MGTVVLGIVLVVIGVIALLAGVGGGIAQMVLEIKKKVETGQAGLFDFPTQVVEVLIKFLNALMAAPVWLALVIIGLLLIIYGGSML